MALNRSEEFRSAVIVAVIPAFDFSKVLRWRSRSDERDAYDDKRNSYK